MTLYHVFFTAVMIMFGEGFHVSVLWVWCVIVPINSPIYVAPLVVEAIPPARAPVYV